MREVIRENLTERANAQRWFADRCAYPIAWTRWRRRQKPQWSTIKIMGNPRTGRPICCGVRSERHSPPSPRPQARRILRPCQSSTSLPHSDTWWASNLRHFKSQKLQPRKVRAPLLLFANSRACNLNHPNSRGQLQPETASPNADSRSTNLAPGESTCARVATAALVLRCSASGSVSSVFPSQLDAFLRRT